MSVETGVEIRFVTLWISTRCFSFPFRVLITGSFPVAFQRVLHGYFHRRHGKGERPHSDAGYGDDCGRTVRAVR